MSRAVVTFLSLLIVAVPCALAAQEDAGSRAFTVASGGRLVLELDAGGTVEIVGSGGSQVVVDYQFRCEPGCDLSFDQGGDEVRIRTKFSEKSRRTNSDIELSIRVPDRFDVEVDSNGGGLSIEGVDGTFRGKTMGGAIELRDLRGEVRLKTMGGGIALADADVDGSLETMGGEVRFENVVGDVRGKSMGGDVRYVNVRRRDGGLGSPDRVGGDDISPDTVQISTMGGDIEVEDAPEGADVHTMGGDIEIMNARRFVRAKTMGGDIVIESVDGSVRAVTMGGDVDVKVVGDGGDIVLQSMTGDVRLVVPAGFGMDLDVELAFTKNSRGDYRIEAPGGLPTSVSDGWDDGQGTPRKTMRMAGAVNGGGHRVRIETINGDVSIEER